MYFEKPRELMESLMKSMATIIQVTNLSVKGSTTIENKIKLVEYTKKWKCEVAFYRLMI